MFLLFIKDWYNQDALRNLTSLKAKCALTIHPKTRHLQSVSLPDP